MMDVVDSRLVLPGAIIGALSGQKQPESATKKSFKNGSGKGSNAERRCRHNVNSQEPPRDKTSDTEESCEDEEDAGQMHGDEDELTIDPVKIPEELETAVVTQILEKEKAKKDLQTAEDVAKVAFAFDGLRCMLADTCVAAHSRAVTAAAAAEEHVIVLEELQAALKSASSLFGSQHEPALRSARYLTSMVESNTVLGSSLKDLLNLWQNTSFMKPPSDPSDALDPQSNSSAPHIHPTDTGSNNIIRSSKDRTLETPAQEQSKNKGQPMPDHAVRVPSAQTGLQDTSKSSFNQGTSPPEAYTEHSAENTEAPASGATTDQHQKLLKRGRELRDISGIVNKMLYKKNAATESAWAPEKQQQLAVHPDWIQSRRLGLSIDPEQLLLEDERSAAQSYAAMIAREEALAAAARTAGQREAQALAAAAAAESETETARLELVRLHEIAESMRVERDKARTSADSAQQQRLLIEHYSKVLAERLLRQQTAVNAAAAATGRDLSYISIATQTSESVLCNTSRTAGTAQHASSTDQQEAYVSYVSAAVPLGEIQGGEMAAALRSRDAEAFQMLLDALHQLPHQWLLSLPTRLLRVLAGEGFTLGASSHQSNQAPAAADDAAREAQGGALDHQSSQLSQEHSSRRTAAAAAESLMSSATDGDSSAPSTSTGRMRVSRKAELATKGDSLKHQGPKSLQSSDHRSKPNSPGNRLASSAAPASSNSRQQTSTQQVLGGTRNAHGVHDQDIQAPQATAVPFSTQMNETGNMYELSGNGGMYNDHLLSTGPSLLLSMENLDDPAVMNDADSAMLSHHQIEPASLHIPTGLELEAGVSRADVGCTGAWRLLTPEGIPESGRENGDETDAATGQHISEAPLQTNDSLRTPSSSLGPSQQSLEASEDGGVEMGRFPSRKTVKFSTAIDVSQFGTMDRDEHNYTDSQSSQQSDTQQAVQSRAPAEEQEEQVHCVQEHQVSEAATISAGLLQAAGSANGAAPATTAVYTAGAPGGGHSPGPSNAASLAERTNVGRPHDPAASSHTHQPTHAKCSSNPASSPCRPDQHSSKTPMPRSVPSAAGPEQTRLRPINHETSTLASPCQSTDAKRCYNLAPSAATRSPPPHILSSTATTAHLTSISPDTQGSISQRSHHSHHATAAELRRRLPELPSITSSLQLQSFPAASSGLSAPVATQRPLSALACAFTSTQVSRAATNARTGANSGTRTQRRTARTQQQQHEHELQQNAAPTQQRAHQRVPKSMGSVALRAVQSAREVEVPRSAIVDRARLIQNELHQGVWDSQDSTERSRLEQMAAAVDSNIRRAGRSTAPPSGASLAANPGRSHRPSTAASASLNFSPTRNTPTRSSSSARRSTASWQQMHADAPVATSPSHTAAAQSERFWSYNHTRNTIGGANDASPRPDSPDSYNAASSPNRNNALNRSASIPIMQQSVYGRSVPQLVDSEHDVSLRNLPSSGMVTGGFEAEPHVAQERLVLKDIPSNTFAPSGAATATSALEATPGGAAALNAIQRGAVSQALREAGFQLGILVSSSDAQTAPEATNSPMHMIGVSKQGQVALDMLLLDVCQTMGCSSIPLLYVRPDAVARAYFLALPRDLPESSIPEGFPEALRPLSWALHPTFVITSEVLELLDRGEIRALFGSLLAFFLAPGGCGFDASSDENLLELSGPLLDALGAATNLSTFPGTHFSRPSTRGRTRSIMHDDDFGADIGADVGDATYATTAPRRASTRRRASTSPSRMHGSAPRLSTAPAAVLRGLRSATLAAAATAAALQELAPGLLSSIGMGHEERQWKARSGWAAGGLEAMIRRAVPLLRMASDRGAMLACQDIRVVERMIVKMECGSASLVRHISLPSLRNDAQRLLSTTNPDPHLGSDLMHSPPQQPYLDTSPRGANTSRHSTSHLNLNKAREGARQTTMHARGARATASASSSMRAASASAARPSGVNFGVNFVGNFGGNFGVNALDLSALSDSALHGNGTVLRLAALHRWVASSEYETIMTKYVVRNQ